MAEERVDASHVTARAVVRVEPGDAARYWQALSETLARLGAEGTHLEISVVDRLPGATGVSRPELVELELRSPDLEQATLDDAIGMTPRGRVTRTQPLPGAEAHEHRATPAHLDQATLDAAVPGRVDVTISAPLIAPLDQTLVAPLHVAEPVAEDVQIPEPRATPPPLERSPPPEGPRSTARAIRVQAAELIRLLAVVAALLLGVRSLVQTFRVDGPSMEPNFETGQRLLVNKAVYWHIDGTPLEGLVPVRQQGSIAYLFGGPHRGDVVVFRPPGDSNFDSDLIKRIIGLPGDTVSIQNGQVYVNGDRLSEPFIKFPADYTFPAEGVAVRVPNDNYFVLGDNRPVSADSHLGWLVPAEKLIGQAWLSYWPVQRWGFTL